MIASGTAWPESGWAAGKPEWPDSDPGWQTADPARQAQDPASSWPDGAGSASGTGWPGQTSAPAAHAASRRSGTDRPGSEAALPAARPDPRVRPSAYRQLWQPPGRSRAPRQAIGQPYVWDGGEDAAGRPGPADGLASKPLGPQRRGKAPGADALTGPGPITERAVIGDLLRELAAWCQIGGCIARHTDAAALGEADIRNKAVAAGWCVDLFGRMVCPSCRQRYPVWSARPPAVRNRG